MSVQYCLIPGVNRSVFVVKQGTAVSFQVTLDVTQLPSQSVIGFVADFRAKRTLTQPAYDIYLPAGSGSVTIVDYQTLQITLQPTDTQLLLPGDYFWESRLTYASQSVDTRVPYSLYGEIFLLQSL